MGAHGTSSTHLVGAASSGEARRSTGHGVQRGTAFNEASARSGRMYYSEPTDGISLAYPRRGSGPPVVMIHGSPGDHTEYDRLAPLVAPHAAGVVGAFRG